MNVVVVECNFQLNCGGHFIGFWKAEYQYKPTVKNEILA
jgi:hypothetical protein